MSEEFSTSLRGLSFLMFTKGLRVTRDHEEFQRIWPVDPSDATLTFPTERDLCSFEHWPEVLSELLRLRPSRLAEQHSLFVTPDSATMVLARRFRDPHRRPAILIASASCAVSWSEDNLAIIAGTLQQIASSVADREVVDLETHGNDRARALRLGEAPITYPWQVGVNLGYWTPLAAELTRYKGIVGISTPALFLLGANVVVGTEHEAAQVRSVRAPDAIYSPQSQRFIRVSDRLVPWPVPNRVDDSQSTTHDPQLLPSVAEVSTDPALGEAVDAIFAIEAALREHNEREARRMLLQESAAERVLSLLGRSASVLDRLLGTIEYLASKGKKR